MTPTQQIGAIIKAKRVENNLYQKQLAELAFKDQMYQGFISQIEKGNIPVRFEDVSIILSIFKIDLIKLIKNAN